MHTMKALGLGTLFSIAVLVVYSIVTAMRSGIQASHATGLGAVKSGTVYNPYFWLVLVVAYGAAFWLVRKG